MPPEYNSIYCRHCASDVFAPRSTPFRVNALPSPYWAELTDLWFCHTDNNAHVDRIAATKIAVEPGKILLDKIILRVHKDDIVNKAEAWRRHASIKKVMRMIKEDQPMGDAESSPAATAGAAPAKREIWSPLPCNGCTAILGSILLTVSPSLGPDALQPSAIGEVRLLKYQLSNCFRRRTDIPTHHPTLATNTKTKPSEPTAMQVDDTSASPSTSVAPHASSSPSGSSASSLSHTSCLCSTFAPSPLLTCSNMFVYYSFENFICEDLIQRYHKQPIGKFLIESVPDDDEEDDAAVGNNVPISNEKIFIRLFVVHWDACLSSTLTDAFPYTPHLLTSNTMIPAIKVDFDVHRAEEEPAVQTWIYGRKKKNNTGGGMHMPANPTHAHSHSSACQHDHTQHQHAHSSSHATSSPPPSFPPNIDRLFYSDFDCRALVALLQSRSHMWPESTRGALFDTSGMQKACIAKLTKAVKP